MLRGVSGSVGRHSSSAAECEELEVAVSLLDLPVALIDLTDLRVRAVSKTAWEHSFRSEEHAVGLPAIEWIEPQNRALTNQALEALRAGVIDSYRADRRIIDTEGSFSTATLWVKAVTFAEQRMALIQVSYEANHASSPLGSVLGQEPLDVAVGTMDMSWVVKSVSNDIEALLGVSPETLIGTRLMAAVDTRDLRTLLDAGTKVAAQICVAVRVLRPTDRGPTVLSCVLTRLAASDDLLFALTRQMTSIEGERGSAERASRLEHHLQRIAAEVEASGVLHQLDALPNPADVREMKHLTSRQWEVLSRLLKGERVPTIAADLFISQSTVRNHLAGIFERFGVHSQPELLAVLAARRMGGLSD
jgi:DNA-binding NarL/FixJ family response regulator